MCVLDALDECNELARVILVDKLYRFYQWSSDIDNTNAALEFIMTSRPYRSIEIDFDLLIVRLTSEEESESIRHEIDTVIEFKMSEISS